MDFSGRRERYLAEMGEGIAVFPAAEEMLRNGDVHHAYRQDSDLHYLTGFNEPNSVLVLTNQHKEHRAVLFVPPRDPKREIWDGPRAGVEGAVRDYGVDAAYTIDELDDKLPEYLQDVDRLHYRWGQGAAFDDDLLRAIDVVKGRRRRRVSPPSTIIDASRLLHEHRLIKSEQEIAAMKRALEITGAAHEAAMLAASPGMHEYEVEAELLSTFRKGGSPRAAYDSIVGAGVNGTILHYILNDAPMKDGDLLLIDAGCELDYYASDITRTFPINGRFSDAQKAIYNLVLEAELASIEATKPGATLEDVHDASVNVLVTGLIELGLLEGSVEEQIESEGYKAFYMHRTSHWLGMDVHDVGQYHASGEPRPLEPGMVLTIEPGLYIAPDAEVDEKWRGIGVRIEDDILVTADGHENLSSHIPKTVDEIEALMAEG